MYLLSIVGIATIFAADLGLTAKWLLASLMWHNTLKLTATDRDAGKLTALASKHVKQELDIASFLW